MANSSIVGRYILSAGLVLGFGAGVAGYLTASSYDGAAVDMTIRGAADIAKGGQEVRAAYEDAVRDVAVVDVAPKNAWIARDKAPGADGKLVKTPEGKVARYAPIFFPPNLWLVRGGEKGLAMRDLLSMENPEKPDTGSRLHERVPNEWFFRYGLDAVIGDSNALKLDSDGDGFTNEEEFDAGTDPGDAAKYPPFMTEGKAKMVFVKRHTDGHAIELSSMSDFSNAAEPSIVINIYAGALKKGMPLSTLTRTAQVKDLKPESTFGFSDAADSSSLSKTRFKVLSATAPNGIGSECIEVEDTGSFKESARRFILAKGAKNAHSINDVEVTLRVTAGSAKGQLIDHAIKPGETFSVPGFPGTECTLISATKDGARIKVGEAEVKIDPESAPAKAKK